VTAAIGFPSRALLPRRRVSRLPFHWSAADFELEAISRGPNDTGATFSRATTASPLDINGQSRTVVYAQPAWEMVDWDNDGSRERPTLLLGASDKLFYTYSLRPTALTIYVEFVENGTLGIASAAILYVGGAGNTGPRLWIDSTGTQYRVRHNNGISEVDSTLTGAAPVNGDRVVLRATLKAGGNVQINQSRNGGAETSATESAALAPDTAWGAPSLYLGTTGDTNPGNVKLALAKIDFGARTATQMREAW
jgi:hypothetical protein